ncbi:ubiquinone biosynthesis methyltransferase UbiE [Streptomyces sp. NRRL WC-3618]|uniref:class I SAM-dependent methyltransferase n=1 Tax=Streptomyces sp. NRRL WC-3618 TaxID=1519490 RepID=UPI0006AF79ED|nr:class I SAM-dependent methyltransferase [Streptomyces sp. NRRL WC-3618]KOV87882.1 ubiquinone biosynthesis methyltransferase UbiE [Streptomyces sp. NRRL WC-3618]
MTTYEQRAGFVDAGHHPEEEKATVKSVYQQVANEYDERIPGLGPSDDMFTQSERDFLIEAIRSGEKVLDIGCGTGRFTVPMAEKGADVSGLDISRPMLDVASRKLAERGLSADLREGDMAHLPFPDASFDTVTSMLALMHVPMEDRQAVFGEVARVLRPGGRMLLGVKNSVFEEMFTGDRFASVDVTDVAGKQLLFTKTRSGEEYVAPWYSFSPQDLTTLFATVGMTVTRLRGNSPLAVWLADEVLRDESVRAFVSKTERFLAEIPPFNHFGYHLLAEATKPRA